MPVHDVGYRKWDGERTSQFSRMLTITETGIRLSGKSRWVKRMMFFAWLPVLYWGIGFFVLENSMINTTLSDAMNEAAGTQITAEQMQQVVDQRKLVARAVRNQFPMIPRVDELADALESGDEETTRSVVWSWLLMTFFRYPQALLILFLVGSIAPALISRDLRSRAYLMYFSRPIGKLEYIVGKLLIPTAFIVFVTTLPALALYVFAVMMSPDLSVIWSTWDIPIRIIGATVTLVIPTASLALMLSSLTQESRFANFAWFAVWALGHGAWLAIVLATAVRLNEAPVEAEVMSTGLVQNMSVLSLYNNLGDIQSWIFGFGNFADVWRGILALAMITVISLVILYRRVSAPIRV